MTTMKAWVLGGPGQLTLVDKPVPSPGVAEVLVRIDATAICATDLEVISHGPPATIGGEPPFNKNFTPGHEYMGTIVEVGPTVDEFAVGERVAVEIHAGCGRCERCRQGMYTSCLNYGRNYGEFNKGHRANGFTTDGGFAQYAVNHVNTLVRVPEHVSDEVATLIVTAGTAMYGVDVLGGLDRWRKPRRHRRRANRPLRRRGRQSARRQPGDPHRHRRQPSCGRHARRRRRCDQRVDRAGRRRRAAADERARRRTSSSNARAHPMRSTMRSIC